jgi:16S rRNA (adenine1518-N6/adenine1519-N6)-dimethyltransferase
MQKQSIIRELLYAADAHPCKALGQCFLVDLARMQQVVDLADIRPGQTVLEVGPGTGSLTEELLDRAGLVVAVELDRKLAAIMQDRFSDQIESGRLILIEADALAGKHKIEPAVMEAVGESADLVANLPYQIATPLVANMMIESWAHCVQGAATTRFDRLTFTVQKEVGERLAATAGSAFGTVSVLLQCLSDVTLGPVFPAGAFWPAPKIASQLVHIEFNPAKAKQLHDVPTLQLLLHMAFTQRRKHIGGTVRARNAPFERDVFAAALAQCEIDPTTRADALAVEQYRTLANTLHAVRSDAGQVE